jgi:hypothetical protein
MKRRRKAVNESKQLKRSTARTDTRTQKIVCVLVSHDDAENEFSGWRVQLTSIRPLFVEYKLIAVEASEITKHEAAVPTRRGSRN